MLTNKNGKLATTDIAFSLISNVFQIIPKRTSM